MSMSDGLCDGCRQTGTRELLQIPSRASFSPAQVACEGGARNYGLKWTRRLPVPALLEDAEAVPGRSASPTSVSAGAL